MAEQCHPNIPTSDTHRSISAIWGRSPHGGIMLKSVIHYYNCVINAKMYRSNFLFCISTHLCWRKKIAIDKNIWRQNKNKKHKSLSISSFILQKWISESRTSSNYFNNLNVSHSVSHQGFDQVSRGQRPVWLYCVFFFPFMYCPFHTCLCRIPGSKLKNIQFDLPS